MINIILLFLATFFTLFFLLNLSDFWKNRKFNKWVKGFIEKVEIIEDQEIWSIRWKTPEALIKLNPNEGFQYYYFKFAHLKKFNKVEEKSSYIIEKNLKLTGNKFYLSLMVDSQGVIKEVTKYNGYLQKALIYGILNIIFIIGVCWMKGII